MDRDLEEILDGNPWDEMATKVEEALVDSNTLQAESFVLSNDSHIIHEFTDDYRGGSTELLLNLPPQPFIGTPDAKIWILQFNPGYSKTIDDFDYLGLDFLPREDKHKNISIFSSTTLSDRLSLVCQQYRLVNNICFYALDEKFHTFKYGLRKGSGMYLWYQNVLFKNPKSIFHFVPEDKRKAFADENLFVLEFFPYHSKGFGGINFFPFLPSFDFWRVLVQYALTHEKILICHGLSSCKSLTAAIIRSLKGYDAAKRDGRIYRVVRSGNGPSRLKLNKRNVVSMSSTRDRLDEFCRMWPRQAI